MKKSKTSADADKPLVSIIIPTYNREKYILNAINSCLKQTYKNIEILVVDDCSTDKTKDLIKSINDKRIKYFRNETNRGAPYSRNFGLRIARGEYINFLDDDDLLLPRKIELQLKKFLASEDEKLGVVTCDVRFIRIDMDLTRKNRKKGNIYKDLLMKYCVYGTETMLIKKRCLEQIRGFDTKLQSDQEYDLAMRLARICHFDYVPETLTVKKMSTNQISFTYRKKIAGSIYFFRKHKQEFRKLGLKGYLFNVLRYYYSLAEYSLGLVFGRNASVFMEKLKQLFGI